MTVKTLVTIHGIRTHYYQGWQYEAAGEALAEIFTHERFQYGYVDCHNLVHLPVLDMFKRVVLSEVEKTEEVIDLFARRYGELESRPNFNPPSVVAHSFGTYILAMCLKKHPHIKFDAMILCGSALSENFDWSTLVQRGQVKRLWNYHSTADRVISSVQPPWLSLAPPEIGRAGCAGFKDALFSENPLFRNIAMNQCDHSDYFANSLLVKYEWRPFLLSELDFVALCNAAFSEIGLPSDQHVYLRKFEALYKDKLDEIVHFLPISAQDKSLFRSDLIRLVLWKAPEHYQQGVDVITTVSRALVSALLKG